MSTPRCSICYSIYGPTEEFTSTACGHVFHNDCVSRWLCSSETCPQCRERCYSNQLKRVYIDFTSEDDSASEDDLACAQPQNIEGSSVNNSGAAETIEMLLEHLGGPKPACEYCEDLQTALENFQTENALIISTLDATNIELDELRREIVQAERRNAELQSASRRNESNIQAMEQRMHMFENEKKALNEVVQELQNSLWAATIEYNNIECERNRMAHLLDDKNRQNGNLVVDNQGLLKRIEELQTQMCAKGTEPGIMHKTQVIDRQDMCGISSHNFNRLEEMSHKRGEVKAIELAKMGQSSDYENRENARTSPDNKKIMKRTEELPSNICASKAELDEFMRKQVEDFSGNHSEKCKM